MDELESKSNKRQEGDAAIENRPESSQLAELGINTLADNRIYQTATGSSSLVDANKASGAGSSSYLERLLGQGVIQTGLAGTETEKKFRTAELGKGNEPDQAEKKTAQYLRDGNDSAKPFTQAKEGTEEKDTIKEAAEKQEKEKYPVTVEYHPDLSPSDRAWAENLVKQALDKMPEHTRKLLSESRVKIQVADKLSDLDPSAATRLPVGHPGNYKVDTLRGQFEPNTKAIQLAVNPEGYERYDERTQKAMENDYPEAADAAVREADAKDAHDFSATIDHETGHAIDRSLGQKAGLQWLSDSQEFQEAFRRDKWTTKNLGTDANGANPILLKDESGPKEVFAEIINAIRNGGVALTHEDLKQRFPNSWRVVEKHGFRLRDQEEARNSPF